MNLYDIRPDLKIAQDRLITLEEVEAAIATGPQAIINIGDPIPLEKGAAVRV